MQLQDISGNKIIDYDGGLWYYLNDKKFLEQDGKCMIMEKT